MGEDGGGKIRLKPIDRFLLLNLISGMLLEDKSVAAIAVCSLKTIIFGCRHREAKMLRKLCFNFTKSKELFVAVLYSRHKTIERSS